LVFFFGVLFWRGVLGGVGGCWGVLGGVGGVKQKSPILIKVRGI